MFFVALSQQFCFKQSDEKIDKGNLKHEKLLLKKVNNKKKL